MKRLYFSIILGIAPVFGLSPVLGAQEAVAMGLCDAVGTLHDALAWLHSQTKK